MTRPSWSSPDQAPWLDWFADEPDQALLALLSGRAYLGRLNGADPEQLLLDWAGLLGEEFASDLDVALQSFLAAHWQDDGLVDAPDLMMHRCFRVVALLDPPPERTLSAVWDLRTQARSRLSPLVTSAARDALGWFWAALSRHQLDDSMVPTWFETCRLSPGTPAFHGRYALLGLRRAPGEDLGGFRQSFAEGLQQFVVAVAGRVDAGDVAQRQGERFVKVELEHALRTYPFPGRWSDFWSGSTDLGPLAERWVKSVFGPTALSGGGRRSHRRVRQVQPDRAWVERSNEVATHLARGQAGVTSAQTLLDEQRRYFRATGHTYNLVRSLCRFSSALLPHDAVRSLSWAREAWEIAPENPYPWTSLFRALLGAGHAPQALTVGFAAIDRFPDDVVAANGLADVLKNTGRLAEAEKTYRQTLALHPQNEFAAAGLADVLKLAGRLQEAESTYRQTLAQHPDNVVAAGGLAHVLKNAGQLAEAERIFRQLLTRQPDDGFAAAGLAEVLKIAGRLGEAEEVYRQHLSRHPRDAYATSGLADLLKQTGRLDEAERTSRQLLAEHPENAAAAAGLTDVLKTTGRAAGAARTDGPASAQQPEDEEEGVPPTAGAAHEASRRAASAVPEHTRSDEQEESSGTVPPAERTPGADERAVGPDDVAVDDSATLPVDRGLSLRAEAVRLRLAPDPERARVGSDLLVAAQEHLAENTRDVDALFTQIETLAALGRVPEADEALDRLPDYVRKRPEFQALRGTVRLTEVAADPVPAYDADRLERAVQPWRAAAERQPRLRTAPFVVQLRAASAMHDGAALDEVRRKSASRLRSSLVGRPASPTRSRGASEGADLDAWFSAAVASVLRIDTGTDGEAAAADDEALVGTVQAEQATLDALQASLVSAARYWYAPAA